MTTDFWGMVCVLLTIRERWKEERDKKTENNKERNDMKHVGVLRAIVNVTVCRDVKLKIFQWH